MIPRARLLLLSAALLTGCSVNLVHDLPEDDANDIYALLQKNGITATKTKDEGGNEPRFIISVNKPDVASAAQLLREYSLPRPKADGLAVFKKMKGMIPTQTEEKGMYIEALGGEVSNAFNRVPGVLEARAIVVIPEVNDLTQPDKKPLPSASVFVKYRPLTDGKLPLTDDQVKSFVATAVPEMKRDNVTVLMTQAMPPEAEVNPDMHMQTVLGLRMTKPSAEQFKIMVAVAGLLILAMAGLTVWNFMRGSGGPSHARPRSRPPPEA
ncbi:MAG: type III secretion protein [Myxococcales bacterium]|nr:type III secretion protein [Myxococcales bacterium]